MAKERISELEGELTEIIKSGEQKKKKRMKKNELSLRELWNTNKHINLGI